MLVHQGRRHLFCHLVSEHMLLPVQVFYSARMAMHCLEMAARPCGGSCCLAAWGSCSAFVRADASWSRSLPTWWHWSMLLSSRAIGRYVSTSVGGPTGGGLPFEGAGACQVGKPPCLLQPTSRPHPSGITPLSLHARAACIEAGAAGGLPHCRSGQLDRIHPTPGHGPRCPATLPGWCRAHHADGRRHAGQAAVTAAPLPACVRATCTSTRHRCQ